MASKKITKPPVSFDILSGLGQELHAPLLSLIKSSSRLIEDYKKRDFEYIAFKDFKKIMTTLELMNRQLERCAQTTDRMIHLHQIKKQGLSDHSNLNEVLKSVLDLLGQQLRNVNISVILHLAKGLPKAAIANVEAHQVIYNILSNAVQAMPAGGKLKIRTVYHKTDVTVRLFVEDEGVGIPPEHLTKVFEPFFTTKERGVEKNSGLGLSIVHAIVSAAKGSIDIQSSLRQGTVVRVDLPAYQK